MKYIAVIFLILLLNSCLTNKSIVGLYGKCESSYFVCNQIELKSDSTFEYFNFMDVGGVKLIKGNWDRKSKNKISLNSFDQPKNARTTYVGRINPSRTNIKVKVTSSQISLAAANVFLNNENNGTFLNTNGIVEFAVQKVKTITFSFLGRTETIEIENSDYNEIEVFAKDLNLTNFFTNEIIVINKWKLLFNNKLSLKKTSLKNKQWK